MKNNPKDKGVSFEHVKGTVDFYPPQSTLVRSLFSSAEKIFKLYGYEEIILPILEERKVFIKSVGETTDIVEKQMFRIEGRDLVLRPEGTAQVVRFFKEKSLHKKKDFYKFFYLGPMFRGERPQKGRLRQFNHLGCEVFGSHSPYIDAEVIKLAFAVLNACGAPRVKLVINSLGCAKDKQRLIEYISAQLAPKEARLCDLCRKRIKTNPLRVLDCKSKSCRDIVAEIPLGKDQLCPDCRNHFEQVLDLLERFSLPYTYDPKMVRGLDYYTHTVFEFISSDLGAQDACGAGGRYNGLVSRMGGPDIPALGFALGLERIMLMLKDQAENAVTDTFVVCTSFAMAGEALKIVDSLRSAGISSDMCFKQKSLKSQLRAAERQNSFYTVLVGEEELKEGCLIIRNMRESTQEKIPVTELVSVISQKINIKK